MLGTNWLISTYVPKGKPRELMRALLQMTMATDDATESASDPTTPSWNPDIVAGQAGSAGASTLEVLQLQRCNNNVADTIAVYHQNTPNKLA